jgi:hypothetical protein
LGGLPVDFAGPEVERNRSRRPLNSLNHRADDGREVRLGNESVQRQRLGKFAIFPAVIERKNNNFDTGVGGL